MKAATAKLLRAVIRLVEDDVRELADTVVEIDEREALHWQATNECVEALFARVSELEANEYWHRHLTMHIDGIEHSRKVEP